MQYPPQIALSSAAACAHGKAGAGGGKSYFGWIPVLRRVAQARDRDPASGGGV